MPSASSSSHDPRSEDGFSGRSVLASRARMREPSEPPALVVDGQDFGDGPAACSGQHCGLIVPLHHDRQQGREEGEP